MQLDQFAPAGIQAELWRRMAALTGIRTGRSKISMPSSRALHLDQATATGPADAFLVETEFTHLHGDGSGSLHLALPSAVAREVIATGRGERHPAVALGLAHPTLVMLFGPRDADELEVVWRLVQASHAYARSGDNES
ncbi:luciferase family protein [Lentzea sp.]|uniref:luciferase domain-containing protein n=1 Tax=Lentzea sp. TaxID=56099 RepID=UPI002C19436C|nr:luciferase family protein [Lentzea sp.]HUQ55578.1 luciferase family protein [Lentzea sp.]